MDIEYKRLDNNRIEIPRTKGMNTNCIIYVNHKLENLIKKDKSLHQVQNVAHLPGIVGSSLAMPDIHQGYGFPIGGVAAFSMDNGIISPGGVGYDINCGVRVLVSNLLLKDIKKDIRTIVEHIYKNIPCGIGSKRNDLNISKKDFKNILKNGSYWALENGYANENDIDCTEDNGRLKPLIDIMPSSRAIERGIVQLGTLGSGNHFIEIGYIDKIYNPKAAALMGIHTEGQVTVAIHSGSRGLGHQICTDSINKMIKATQKHNINIPDKQLSCTPINSDEGREYYSLMAMAANFAFTNRQIMAHWIRECFSDIFSKKIGSSMELIYDVCHNIAKIEKHTFNNETRKLCVHRKGATRSFGPNDHRIPKKYREIGQPVIIPGDMGRYSFILLGTQEAMDKTFGSTCHGAGRLLSRNQAIKNAKNRNIRKDLEQMGIYVISAGRNTILEEYPEAYKNITDIIDTVTNAEISRNCIRLKPLGVVKG